MQTSLSSPVSLADLGARLTRVGAEVHGNASVVVSELFHDSRRVRPGTLFVARPGQRVSGLLHLEEAERRGAVALMVERGTTAPVSRLPRIEVSDIRLGMALAAELIYQSPSQAIEVVGVTGTNGKTTTAWLCRAALAGAGARAAELGTLGYTFESEHVEGVLTTPEADDLSRYLARARANHASHCVMEVSSHSLAQARVDALRFAVAVFTNLTQDHLDYHGSMEAYSAAKWRLFAELDPRAAVVNVDDATGEKFAAQLGARCLRVSTRQKADVCARHVTLGAEGIRADVEVTSESLSLTTRLVGAHNLENLLLSLAVVRALGLDVAAAARALSELSGAPGRLERCDEASDDIVVLVDYAHTPDALARALEAVRPLTSGQVLCVFGCGGDRDPLKRPLMGRAVAQHADFAFVTNDNPRSEDPAQIIDAIVPGLSLLENRYCVEPDRAAAIEQAILRASPGDVVLIAGKGHETYQIVGDTRLTFDDRVVARQALVRRREQEGH